MKKLIDEIKAGIKEVGFKNLDEQLGKCGSFIWEMNYPIAVVHSSERIKEKEIVTLFQKQQFLNKEGFTHSSYDKEQLDFLSDNAPQYLQMATMMCLKTQTPYPQPFKSKFPKDYWKKMQETDHVKSVIEMSSFTDKDTKCSVEFSLREVMRKRKEVNVLKKLGYVWIAEIPKTIDIEVVFKHYFLENYSVVYVKEMAYLIGWNETLGGINMRYFVCPPK